MESVKTNVMRTQKRAGVSYTPHCYDVSDGLLDGASTARKLGLPPERIYKTLVALGTSGKPCVFVIPVERELDLKAAARAAREKSVAMLPLKELTRTTGYVRGGCSPIGMKKRYRTVLDRSCEALPSMLVSAGKIGMQVELAPPALAAVTQAELAPVCMGG